MKKFAFILCAMIATAGSSLFATSAANDPSQQTAAKGPSQLGQMQNQGMAPDCSQLSPDEQNFAAQVMDMNNRMMFCSQFTPQQRQQAMQMMGQPDANGNMMSADQAVRQTMSSNSMAPMSQNRQSSSNCSQLTTDEQNFAAQIMDMNNRTMFCSQFTPQQRQQAMQMMGQSDANGNMMTADQAVRQTMSSSGMAPKNQNKQYSGGGCPVK